MTRHYPLRSVVLALAVAGVCRAAATAPATRPDAGDVPLRGVTLYTSGVGFFRHEGAVSGDGTAVLRFKTQQINDVLKSLVVQDAGGRVTGVSYPSAEPTEKTLKGFQVDLSNNPSLGELLRQLRGERVSFDFDGGQPVRTGILVGLSKKAVAGPQVAVVDAWVATLMEGNDRLTQVRLDDAAGVTVSDKKLNAELQQALVAIAAGRDQDKKPVTIAFTGPGEHRLRLGYVVETPVWKTSYRLLMDPKASALQGWAIVENQSDADWNDVTLNLVSGRPISFVMDLYSPLYNPRPVVQLDLFQGLRPQVYGGGMAAQKTARSPRPTDEAMDRVMGAAPMATSAAPRVAFGRAQTAAGLSDADGDGAADTSVRTAALTAKLGELFQYTIEHVSLPRQQSSLVPIVTEAITVEPLSVYNAGVLPRNPLNGAMLTNSTGKLLPQGPVTVLDAGAYAGDARIEDLPAGQKRLLSFGVDLETLVDHKEETGVDIVGGAIVKGTLVTRACVRNTETYAVENKADHDKTLVVEQPKQGHMTLVETAAPMEQTDALYRFRLAVPKGGKASLTVTQERVDAEQMGVFGGDVSELIAHSRGGAIPAKVRDAVADALKRRQAVGDLDAQAKAKTDALAGLTAEQTRLRENMKVVDKTDPYYQRLLTKLNAQEGTIEGLQKDHDALTAKAAAARAALESYLEGLNVE